MCLFPLTTEEANANALQEIPNFQIAKITQDESQLQLILPLEQTIRHKFFKDLGPNSHSFLTVRFFKQLTSVRVSHLKVVNT